MAVMSDMPASSRASGLPTPWQATHATVHRLDATSSTPLDLPQASSGAAAHGRALAIGNFDGVHIGHQAIVAQLVQHPGLVPSVLTFEPHPRHFFAHRFCALGAGDVKGPPPIISTLRDRVAGLVWAGAHEVFLGRFNHAMASMPAQEFIAELLLKRLQAREILVGEDFRFGANRQGDFEMLEREARRMDCRVTTWPQVQRAGRRVSSSWVRQALLAGDLSLATTLLGRPYSVSGHVLHGQKLGRQLGFPTLNLRVPGSHLPGSHLCAPAKPASALDGILAVRVHGLADQPLDGVASWGTRPAVTSNGHCLLEVHVLDWSGEAYGRIVQVDCLHKLRNEAHFDSLAALTEQIRLDTAQAREWLAQFKDRPHG
jgi:riboflavin kinase / FMN adenylyltransferase